MTTAELADARAEAERAATSAPQDAILEKLVEKVGGKASVQAVFGDPIVRSGTTVVRSAGKAVLKAGAWSQAPAFLQQLRLLDLVGGDKQTRLDVNGLSENLPRRSRFDYVTVRHDRDFVS
jgi:hypothetical protein